MLPKATNAKNNSNDFLTQNTYYLMNVPIFAMPQKTIKTSEAIFSIIHQKRILKKILLNF